jgi:hypothetical protein
MFTCNGKSEGERTYSDTTLTKSIKSGTIRIDSVPVPYKVEVPVYIRDTNRIDTAKIIEDYFTKKTYSIPFEDSTTKITADISVSENEVKEASIYYEYIRTDTTINNTKIITSKWNMSIGFSGNYYFKDKQPGISITAGLDYKKNRFLIGYDPFYNSVAIGYQYKFFNSKK